MARLKTSAAILCCAAVLSARPALGADEFDDFFESQVRPLLAARCVRCHGGEQESGGLRLDSADRMRQGGESGPAVTPRDADGSRLIRAVRYDGDLHMPPDERLSDAEVATLEQWIRTGAVWPPNSVPLQATGRDPARDHWAFQPVQVVNPPNVEVAEPDDFLRTPIDAFIATGLREVGLAPSPVADRRTLIRRATYTLTGLPPSEADVQAFLDDPRPDAYERLVDDLLASPAYGEHWARHWLDVARYSDTKGYVYGREERFWVHAWAYRDWVAAAFNRDLPYDRFLLLQLAADQVADRDAGDLAAMGFLTLGRRFLGVQRDIIDDRIDVVTRGTMGLTVACARCHDHKYDPIPAADYYSLYGVFASCRERMEPLPEGSPSDDAFREGLTQRKLALSTKTQELRANTAERVRTRIGDYLQAQFELEKYPNEGFDQVISTEDLLPAFVRRWQAYLRRMQLEADPVFSAWHAWLEAAAEQPSPPEALSLDGANPLVAAAFDTPVVSREELVQRYAALFHRIDGEWRALVQAAQAAGLPNPVQLPNPAAEEIRRVLYGPSSPCIVPDEPIVNNEYDFDSNACTELWKMQGEVDRWLIQAASPPPYAMILEDRETPFTPRIFKRGDPAQQGSEVPRQFVALLSGPERQPFQIGSGRLELAKCIVSPSNPLTARVIVNRVWAHHFGAGLVSTPGDFGTRAAPPSHPELLDWLASQLVTEGWSLKSLHRLIVTSGAFRQQSTGPADEEVRGRAMALDPGNRRLWRMNVHRLTFEELRDSLLASAGQLNLQLGGKPAPLFSAPFPRRRSLYGLVDRQFLPGTLRMFDFANPDLHVPQRSDTTVPQQALFLMNHPLMLERARELAAAVHPAEGAAALDLVFQRTLQRSPTETERNWAAEFLADMSADSSTAKPLTAADWSYGYGRFDESEQRVAGFQALPHFTGSAWQGGEAWPDATLGWVQLTAAGGHPGNDRDHACVRRWTAPQAMTIRIGSQAMHEPEPGDGIRAFIVSSRQGLLSEQALHHASADLNVSMLQVEPGETVDFVCDIGEGLNSDQFLWSATIQELEDDSAPQVWTSTTDFPANVAEPLSPLEQLAQVLLCSNEFLFVE